MPIIAKRITIPVSENGSGDVLLDIPVNNDGQTIIDISQIQLWSPGDESLSILQAESNRQWMVGVFMMAPGFTADGGSNPVTATSFNMTNGQTIDLFDWTILTSEAAS